MDSLVEPFAENKLLQALAIAASLIALAIFAYQALKVVFRYFVNWQNKSLDETTRHSLVGARNPSYLLAAFARHGVIMIGFVLFYAIAAEVRTELRSAESPGQAVVILRWVVQSVLWILAFLVGDRGATIAILARRVMREIENQESK